MQSLHGFETILFETSISLFENHSVVFCLLNGKKTAFQVQLKFNAAFKYC